MQNTKINPAQAVIVIDLYCRISQDNDGTTHSVEDQERMGRDWVARNSHLGYVVGKVHADHAKSAWNPKTVRDSWLTLMDRLRSGEANGVWVRNLDRFTRKPREGEDLLELAKGGTIVASKEGTHDLSTARGIKRFRDDMTDSAFESDRISERTKDGKASKALRGKSNASHRGFARPGYLPNPPGWEQGDPRTFVPADQLAREVAAVREAAERLLAGGSAAAICREWNDAGLTTVTGGRWDSQILHQVMRAPSLSGRNLTGTTDDGEPRYVTLDLGEPAFDPDTWDRLTPALDPETWDRLALHYASRKRGRPATAYLLSGILRCGRVDDEGNRCGSPLYGRPLTAKAPYPDGEVARQYWCQVRLREEGGCGRVSIDQRFADQCVEVLVVARMGDPRNSDRIARVAAKMEKQQQALRTELSALNSEADALSDKLGQPGWTVARVDRGLAKYAALIGDVEGQLRALGEIPDTRSAKSSREEAQADWDAADVSGRRSLVKRAFPEGIYLLPGQKGGNALDGKRFTIG